MKHIINKWRERRKSVLVPWLLSYTAILLLPILLSIASYYEADRMLKEEMQRANNTLLQQMQEVMDRQIDEVNRLYVELLWDDKVQSLLYSNRSDKEKLFMATQIARDFNWMKTVFFNITNFYLYWPDQDMILLPGTARDSRFAYQTLHGGMQSGEEAYLEWKRLLERTNEKGFHVLPLSGEAGPKQVLAFIGSLPGQPTHAGSIAILLDSEQLVQMVQNVQNYSGGQAIILDDQGQVLLASSSLEDETLPFLHRLRGEETIFHDDYLSGSEVMYVRSQKTKLTYVSVIPSHSVWEKVDHVRTITYISVGISLLGGGLLTFIFLRRNYSRLRLLIRAFPRLQSVDEERWTDEYQYIQRRIVLALHENEQFSTKLRTHRQWMHAHTLVRLLKGKQGGPLALDDAVTAADIHFLSSHFGVILLAFEDEDAFFERQKGNDLQAKIRLRQFIVTNVMQDVAGRHHQGFATDMEEGVACLINFDVSERPFSDVLADMAEEIRHFLWLEFRIKLIVAGSGIEVGLDGIARAYQSAKDALDYAYITGKREIVMYEQWHEELRPDYGSGYYYPLDIEQQLIQHIKLGDNVKARQTIDAIKYKNVEKLAGAIPVMKCLLFNMASTMIKAVNESDGVGEHSFANKPGRLGEIMQGDNIQRIYDELCEWLDDICQDQREKRALQSAYMQRVAMDERVQRIVRYVDEHYADMDLNIAAIGEHFHLKASYLSKLFKDQMQEGLLDYINKTRIEHAKSLLAKEQLSVGDAAARVGFAEATTFIRVFKRYVNVTPGQFKELANLDAAAK